jgi:hypothetical protein
VALILGQRPAVGIGESAVDQQRLGRTREQQRRAEEAIGTGGEVLISQLEVRESCFRKLSSKCIVLYFVIPSRLFRVVLATVMATFTEPGTSNTFPPASILARGIMPGDGIASPSWR